MFKRNAKRISRVTEENKIPVAVTEKANVLRQRFSHNALKNKKFTINSTLSARKVDCTTKPNTKKLKSKSKDNNGEAIEITKSKNIEKRKAEINPEFHNFFFAYKPPFESKPANFQLKQIANHFKVNFTTNIKKHKNTKSNKPSIRKEWTFFPSKEERKQ